MVNSRQDQKSESIKNYYDAKFLICNACLWCASTFFDDDNQIQNCLTCNSDRLELMPIARTEVYRLNMDQGITLEFWNTKR